MTTTASNPPDQAADVLVIFGITGDLARVMTFRSLYRLERRGLLDCPIVGVAVDDWSLDRLVEAGIGRKVRSAHEPAGGIVGPAMQRAHDVASGPARERPMALEDHGLPVAADVGDEIDTVSRAHERASFRFLGQGVVVPDVRDPESVPHVPGPVLEEHGFLPLEESGIKVARNGKLACGLLELKT